MIILHAAVLDGDLYLWGETPRGDAAPGRRRGRQPRQPQATPSPYDAGARVLAETLTAVLPGLPVRPGEGQDCTLWLPTVAGRPAPSSPLIADPPGDDAPATLAPWKVTALP